MYFDKIPTETTIQILKYSVDEWSEARGHQWDLRGSQSQLETDPVSLELHRYNAVCRMLSVKTGIHAS